METVFCKQAIISAILEFGPLTRREICEKTGFGMATISKTISELQENGIFLKCGRNHDRRDERSSEKISFGNKNVLAGISVGHDYVQGILVNFSGENLFLHEKEYSSREDDIVIVIKEVFSDLLKHSCPLSLGISIHASVFPDKTTILFSTHFAECNGRDIAFEISDSLDFQGPVLVESNAVCDISGEYVFSGLRSDSVLISLADGVGAAFLIDGVILHGNSGNTGGIGHLRVPGNSIPCKCGQTGCLETLVGSAAWRKSWTCLKNKKFYDFNEAISESKDAQKIIVSSLKHLRSAIKNILFVLNPQKLIFSTDIMPEHGDFVFETASKIFNNTDFCCELKILYADCMASAKGAASLGLLHLAGNENYYHPFSKRKNLVIQKFE
jgi:predicted NBD/HSP70 family sugar kinase